MTGAKKSKRKQEKQVRAARRRLMRQLPWYAVGVVAIGLIGAFFVVGGGGGSGSAAEHPVGYEPPSLGSADAPVEFVMWEDFQCPFCRRFNERTLPILEDRYVESGQVRFVWRNFVNYGGESRDSALGAYCAGEQDKFWDYHDILFRNQSGVDTGAFSRNNLESFAEDLELDVDAFKACYSDGSAEYDDIFDADKDLARDGSIVRGTPTFIVNGLPVVGAQPTDDFIDIIESALDRAGP
jgi:protein-disulfide isomerase